MMKKITLAAATALALGLPMTAGAAHAQSRGYNPPSHSQVQRWDAREHNGFYINNRWYSGQPTAAQTRDRSFRPGYQAIQWDGRQHNGFYLNGRWYDGRPTAAQQRQRTFQPGYQAPRWNARQHNGYTYNGRWHYGEPSRQIMQHRSYEPGYRQWRRGDRVSAAQRANYRRVDYRSERLAAPPRGYEYVRTERGDTLLMAVATGVILTAIIAAAVN